MKSEITVLENKQLDLERLYVTQNENGVTVIDLNVPEKFKSFNKKIVYELGEDEIKWDFIEDDKIVIKKEISKYEKVNFYIWLTGENEDDFRSETRVLEFYPNKTADEELTEEESSAVVKMISLMQEEITKVDNIDIDAVKEDNISTITITKKDGTKKSVEVVDGVIGKDGKPGEKGEPRRTWTTRYSW